MKTKKNKPIWKCPNAGEDADVQQFAMQRTIFFDRFGACTGSELGTAYCVGCKEEAVQINRGGKK